MSRYSIYDLIGEEISFKAKGAYVSGTCEEVKRDVLENKITFWINGKRYELADPNKIETDGNKLVFVYGTEQAEDLMAFCGEEYSVHWGEDVRKSIGREKTFFRVIIEREENGKVNGQGN